MTVVPDPNVDPLLGELWALSDHLVAMIREDIAAAKQEAATWQPRPRKEQP